MLTYQDFLAEPDKAKFIAKLIREHRQSEIFKTAVIADEYDARRNTTIAEFVQWLYTSDGGKAVDFTKANNRIASGFFPRLNTQRCAYSLGNGLTFTRTESRTNADGSETTVDLTKEQLGGRFDTDVYRAAYYALIHGVVYGLWNLDHMDVFRVTEFAPLNDEYTGALMAGVRFYRIDSKKPMTAVLYEPDGYTTFRTKDSTDELSLYFFTLII